MVLLGNFNLKPTSIESDCPFGNNVYCKRCPLWIEALDERKKVIQKGIEHIFRYGYCSLKLIAINTLKR